MEAASSMKIERQPNQGEYGQPTQEDRPSGSTPPAPPVRFTYNPNPISAPTPAARPAPTPAPTDEPETLSLWTVALVLALVVGAGLAFITVPAWLPTLGASINGAEPKVYWYLSRATGIISFVLLWLSMASGLLITNKMARVWPGAFTAFDLHQYTSLLGLAFIVVHVIVLLGNQYVPYSITQLLVPFTATEYRPIWVALGQISLYLFLPVTFTFYIRKRIGNNLWHIIHFASYAVFALSLLHGVFSGTDTGNIWISSMYWLGAISLAALTIHRVRVSQASMAKANAAK